MVLATEVWVVSSHLNSPPQRGVIIILNLLKAVVNLEGGRGRHTLGLEKGRQNVGEIETWRWML